jgi:hypothetical protein
VLCLVNPPSVFDKNSAAREQTPDNMQQSAVIFIFYIFFRLHPFNYFLHPFWAANPKRDNEKTKESQTEKIEYLLYCEI